MCDCIEISQCLIDSHITLAHIGIYKR